MLFLKVLKENEYFCHRLSSGPQMIVPYQQNGVNTYMIKVIVLCCLWSCAHLCVTRECLSTTTQSIFKKLSSQL